jgi:putative transposase
MKEVSFRMKIIRAEYIFGRQLAIRPMPESTKGRWQIERSFAWLNHFRRLSKDYEKTVTSCVVFLTIAFLI